MSRRRPTLAAYLRRRWRLIGAIVVLLLGSLLVLAVTDRGHDPIWLAATDEVDQTAVSPQADAVYTLLRSDGNVSRVVAHRAHDGTILWQGPVNATRAVLAAGPDGAAVATDFPLAFLTVYGGDGSIRHQVPLEGNPVALVMEDDLVAVALNAPQSPVLVFQGPHHIRTFTHAAPVRALDLESGLVAVGLLDGGIVVRDTTGKTLLELSLGMSPRGLRLASDGSTLVVGGYGATPADPGGHVTFLDVGMEDPIRWTQRTPVGVGLVDVDAAGLLALAVEESPPSAVVHVYDGATGATRWTRLLAGSVARDDAGAFGGASLSPDARRVAVGTVRGDLETYDARDGDLVWSYRAGGVAALAFAEEDPDRLVVAGRLLANRPFDSLLYFSSAGEPVLQSATLVAVGLGALATLALGLVVGLGFWRARGYA